MKRLRVFFLTVLLSISISGCKSDFLTNSTGQNITPTLVNQEKQNKQANSSEKTSKQNNKSAQEVFYGEWIIKGDIKTGSVSTYSKEEINKLLGRKITYSVDTAIFDKNTLKKPNYNKMTVSEKDFFDNYYVSFDLLGIKNKSIIQIDVCTDKEYKELWDSIGNTFLIKDQNTLILINGGVFFELVRIK